MDKEVIKDVLTKFEDDDYVESKEILSKEIRKEKDRYLKDKLSLKGDIEK